MLYMQYVLNNVSDDCVAFLHKQAKSLGLPIKVYHVYPKKPIVIITWEGTKLTEPTILLNSHMDVVPVFEVSSFSENIAQCVYTMIHFVLHPY